VFYCGILARHDEVFRHGNVHLEARSALLALGCFREPWLSVAAAVCGYGISLAAAVRDHEYSPFEANILAPRL
jgi:hypothetical protein